MIVEQKTLMRLTKAKQRATLRRRLRAAHIAFFETGGNIWTTEEALNAPLVGRAKKDKRGPAFEAITAKSAR